MGVSVSVGLRYHPNIKEYYVRDSCRECAKVWEFVKQYKDKNNKISAACREISELHLIRIGKKTVYRDHEFKELQERLLLALSKIIGCEISR